MSEETQPQVKRHSIIFRPSNIELQCAEDETIADAAATQGITLPISCANGVCRRCQGQRLSGNLVCGNAVATTALENNNLIMCCKASPRSAIEIYMNDVLAPDQKPEVNYAFTVKQIDALEDEIFRIELLAPAGKSLDYWAGQYCLLHMVWDDGREEAIPYSIANAPGNVTGDDPRRLELHIAGNSDTAKSVIAFIKQATIVRITLPAGLCFINQQKLNEWGNQPLVFVAAGSGFSQIKALIESALAQDPKREIHLYWSNRHIQGFYLGDLPQQWSEQYSNFVYHPVIEQEAANWHGRAGWLYEVVHEDFERLDQVQMFACGSPNMVYGTLDQLAGLGLTEHNMHSDVFQYAPRS